MSIHAYTNVLVGASLGYETLKLKAQEDEIKQGKNYYLSAFPQALQLSYLGAIVLKIQSVFKQTSVFHPLKLLCNIGPILAIPFGFLNAAVKHHDYESLAKVYNSKRWALIKLPKTLYSWVSKPLAFLAEYGGDVIQVAIIASSVALIGLGQAAYGGAILTALTYGYIDRKGFIPRKVSLFIERYMPMISTLGVLAGGTLLARVFVAMSVSSVLAPFSVHRYLQQRVDAIARFILRIQGPSLKEMDAPVVKNMKMSYEEICQILESHAVDYEVNPAHCSKPAICLDQLPSNKKFEHFLKLFDTIKWEQHYSLIVHKLKDDDRFIDFLRTNSTFKNKPELTFEDISACIEELAKKSKMSKEKYAVAWVRQEMATFVDILQGKRRAQGMQHDLAEAIEPCEKILAYLLTLNQSVELEDALLKLAIEGGNYCALGIKRASNEILRGILLTRKGKETKHDNPDDYEPQLLQALQNRRHHIVQAFYKETAEMLKVPAKAADDTHGFDIYRSYLCLGFYPLTPFERRQMGLTEILAWEGYSTTRRRLYENYQENLVDAFQEVGAAHFPIYMRNMIHNNERLTEEQKEELIARLGGYSDQVDWSTEESIERFRHFLLVSLGVLRKMKH